MAIDFERQIVLYLIWGMLNDLSVIMDLAMIAITVPGIASLIQSIILNFIYLDIMQTGSWLSPFLKSTNIDDEGIVQEETSLNSYIENSGFQSMNMVENLGSTIIYIGIYLTIVIIQLLL
jgi:hypothetical protein